MSETKRAGQASAPGAGESVSDFPASLAKPALRALVGAGYTRLTQLAQLKKTDLLKLHGMGPKAMEQLRLALEEKGLSFADEERS
ncbi:DNA-binding protein [Paenibacillus ginsengarvi]|uniref:DNA-binding protein n=1 Tax=Paenibacillus ginsengarvi TaxID=400777 RepID=A0A3B0C0A0_9BACL|nr:DNA-binding protein [Paenibacillus ginsengarvi]RKN79225.1 DNA-binding protein [Paenibacillus ginsengarvi]